jgi:hypothetical protein
MLTTVLVLGACSDSDSDGGGETTAESAGVDVSDGAVEVRAGLAMLSPGAFDGVSVDDFCDPAVTAGELTGVFEYAVADLNADETPDPTVTAPWGSTSVTATGPSTNETCTMSVQLGDRLIRCEAHRRKRG